MRYVLNIQYFASKKGGDDTLFCLCDGVVKYEHLGKDRTKVSVYPVA